MNSQNYLEKMKKIQENVLEFLENESNVDKNLENLAQTFDDLKFVDDQHEFKSFLHLITKISNNHRNDSTLYDKIIQILQMFKDQIKEYFSNTEIFNIFKGNKRILLFLIEEKLMVIDEYIFNIITAFTFPRRDYIQYFAPELKPFVTERNKNKYTRIFKRDLIFKPPPIWADVITAELPKNFYERRKTNYFGNEICELIQKDSVEEFIFFINKNNIDINSKINDEKPFDQLDRLTIKHPIYTSSSKLIEYAAFYGSIDIFSYLLNKGAKSTNSLWLYSIHGNNPEIISMLEENKIELGRGLSYEKLFIESIKCHHNNIANYIYDRYLDGNEKLDQTKIIIMALKYYNFAFINNESINELVFNSLCQYDYYFFVKDLLNNPNLDINKEQILKIYKF